MQSFRLRPPRSLGHRRAAGGRLLLATAALAALALPATAQQRPLTTEDPETIGTGRILIEGGIDYARDVLFPVSGLEGNLTRAALLGISIGISPIGEIQIDTGLYNRLSILGRDPDAALAALVEVTGDRTSSVEDTVVATKVRLVSEGAARPAFGVRFATKLPNASNENGLGLDTTDFLLTLLAGKTVESVRVVGNIGVGILGDPTRGDRQNNVLLYGISFARALTFRAEIVGEFNGRVSTRTGEPPPGTGDRSTLRIGGRYTVGTWRLDGAMLFGVTADDPGLGVTAGLTYVFNAFDLP